jgi:serine/threonine protein kinase
MSTETQDEVAIQLEVNIMNKLKHPHIIRFYEFAQDRSNFFIVMELVEGGELFDRIVHRVRQRTS